MILITLYTKLFLSVGCECLPDFKILAGKRAGLEGSVRL